MQWLLYYLSAMTLAGALACAIDKRAAIRRRRRVPERSLLLLCALGGAFGFLAAMLLCRHKTRKPRFFLLVPALCLAWTACLVWALA